MIRLRKVSGDTAIFSMSSVGIAGDVIENPRGVPPDGWIGGKIGQIGVDARRHGVIVAGPGMDIGRETAALGAGGRSTTVSRAS